MTNSQPEPATSAAAGLGGSGAAGGGPDPAPGRSGSARRHAEPLRELASFAVLAGNAVLLVLAVFDLILVIDHWAGEFDDRSVRLFPDFVGLAAIGLPLLAVLLAVFVQPRVPRARLVVLGALAQYALSGFFGVITFLGAFANQANGAYVGDGRAVREAVEDSIRRMVWVTFLVLAATLVVRIWRADYFTPRPRATTFPGYPPGYGRQVHPARAQQQYRTGYAQPYPQPSYGEPYPGYPSVPSGSGWPNQSGRTAPTAAPEPQTAGWPAVPPPPMPNPPEAQGGPTALPPDDADEPTRQIGGS